MSSVSCYNLRKEVNMATTGERIKALRKSKNMNIDQLAEILGVSRSAVSMWEIDRRVPSSASISLMCDLFDVQHDYLTGRSDFRSAEDEIMDIIASEENAASTNETLSIDEKEVIDGYRIISGDNKNKIRNLIKLYQKK